MIKKTINVLLVLMVGFFANVCILQAQDTMDDKSKKKDNEKTSIGGKEHDAEIVGVKIGMDVSTALQAVFTNSNRQPGQEKPDAQRKEGKDIRVLYKNLPQGELQIVFAEGKAVKQVVLKYASTQTVQNLRLPSNGGAGVALSGERFDDRYTIGFTDSKKQERLWWRDEKTENGFSQRIAFTSGNLLKSGSVGQEVIVYKTISVTPGNEDKFANAIK